MMILDITTGRLQWVNAGHPAPLLIRDRAVLDRLEGPTTLPVGFGGQEPVVSERMLQPGDRLLCFTDGLIEEHHRRGSVRRGAARRVDQPDPPRPHRGTGGGTSALPRPETGTRRHHDRRRDHPPHRVARRRRRSPRRPRLARNDAPAPSLKPAADLDFRTQGRCQADRRAAIPWMRKGWWRRMRRTRAVRPRNR